MSQQAKAATCTHDKYWTTVYDNCMACRAENAESQLAAAQQQVEELTAQNYNLQNDSGNLQMVHAHVLEACEMLGMNRKDDVCDTWGLRERCVRVMKQVEELRRERDDVRLLHNAAMQENERLKSFADTWMKKFDGMRESYYGQMDSDRAEIKRLTARVAELENK